MLQKTRQSNFPFWIKYFVLVQQVGCRPPFVASDVLEICNTTSKIVQTLGRLFTLEKNYLTISVSDPDLDLHGSHK